MACIALTGVALFPRLAAAATDEDRITKAGVLRLSDFGPGWRQTPADDNYQEVLDLASDEPECKTYLKIKRESHSLPRRVSPTFTQGDSRSLENTIIVYPSEARAERALRLYQSPSVANCLRQIYPKLLANALGKSSPSAAAQLDSIDVDLGPQSVSPRGDETASYSVTITIRLKSGLQDRAKIEAQTVRSGRAISDFTIRNDEGEFPLGDDVANMIDTSLARIEGTQ